MAQIKKLNKKQSKFVLASIKERLAFYELTAHMNYGLHYVSDQEGYESYDAIFTNESQIRCIGEIKVRKHNSSDYATEWILEKIKYDALTDSIEGRLLPHLKLKPVYICFFYDCVAIWDLNKVNPNSFFWGKFKETSVDGNEELKDKEVCYLDIKDAQIINYILDFDKVSFQAKGIFKFQYPLNSKDILNA